MLLLLPAVNLLVEQKGRQPDEGPATLPTLAHDALGHLRLPRFERWALARRLPAVEGLQPSVGLPVQDERRPLSETRPAFVTLVAFLPVVSFLVKDEGRDLPEGFSTTTACVGSLSSV